MEELFIVGQIVNTQGIKGEIKVYPLTDFPERFKSLKTIFLDLPQGLKEVEIEAVRYQKNMVILKLLGYDSINQVEKWKNIYLKIKPEQAVQLPKGHYFLRDIVGLEVFTLQGERLGVVADILSLPANDVYVIKNDSKEILIPAIKRIVKEINLEEKKMIIDSLEGLC